MWDQPKRGLKFQLPPNERKLQIFTKPKKSLRTLTAKIKRRLYAFYVASSVKRANPLFFKFSYQTRFTKPITFQRGETVLVVGCAGGIGAELSKQLYRRGCNVFGTYFSAKPSPDIFSEQNSIEMDITQPGSISELFDFLSSKCISIQLLVIASGSLGCRDTLEMEHFEPHHCDTIKREFDNIVQTIQVNAIGPMILVKEISKLLKRPDTSSAVPQICILTSSIGTMNHEIGGGMEAYRASRGALHSGFLGLYCDIREHVDVGLLMAGPGSVKTKMTPNGTISPSESAKHIILNAEHCRKKAAFQFLGLNGKRICW